MFKVRHAWWQYMYKNGLTSTYGNWSKSKVSVGWMCTLYIVHCIYTLYTSLLDWIYTCYIVYTVGWFCILYTIFQIYMLIVQLTSNMWLNMHCTLYMLFNLNTVHMYIAFWLHMYCVQHLLLHMSIVHSQLNMYTVHYLFNIYTVHNPVNCKLFTQYNWDLLQNWDSLMFTWNTCFLILYNIHTLQAKIKHIYTFYRSFNS